jgi:dihydrofolate reductase
MTSVVLGMSMSLDGIAGPESDDADGMAVFAAIPGWQFPLRSWREQQGQPGAEDSADSRVWAGNFARFGPQVIGRTKFDYVYPSWGENPPFHAPVFVVTHRGQEPIGKGGGTSYTFVTGGIEAAVDQARALAGDEDVLLAGGVSIARQALAAGLVDEVMLHVPPVLLGRRGASSSWTTSMSAMVGSAPNVLFELVRARGGVAQPGAREFDRRVGARRQNGQIDEVIRSSIPALACLPTRSSMTT